MIHAESNGKSFAVEVKEELVTIDGKVVHWDISPLPDGRWHILYGNAGYTAEVLSSDAGTIHIKFNGRESVVTLRTQLEQRLAAMGFQSKQGAALSGVSAPMPGLITSVRVAAGEKVVQGTPLLVLEAMKMELPLLAPEDATVEAVLCREGELVGAEAVLVRFS